MFVQNFMANHPLVAEILQSGPQLWTGSHTASVISKAVAASMAKSICRTKAIQTKVMHRVLKVLKRKSTVNHTKSFKIHMKYLNAYMTHVCSLMWDTI